jgi:type IV pilus assembly protein PilC
MRVTLGYEAGPLWGRDTDILDAHTFPTALAPTRSRSGEHGYNGNVPFFRGHFMFSRQLSTKHVALACRSLSTSLRAGIPVVKAFDLAINKSGDSHLQRVMRDVAQQVRAGSDITSACRSHEGLWPDLFLNMVDVAERTGSLPEVLRSLAEHYENNLRLQKDFRTRMIMPMVQFVVAIVIVAFLMWLLGGIMIGDLSGKPQDQDRPLFSLFGLRGASGAITWLLGWAIGAVSIYVGLQLAKRSLAVRSIIHKSFLGLPVVGTCLRSFAIARFSWSFALTQEAGLPVTESLEASLAATDNAAFQAATSQINEDIMNGEELAEAMSRTRLFPEDFVQIVHVGETSGTVPETLARLSPEFEDQARRSLATLSSALAGGIWLCGALFAGYIIIRCAMAYAALLDSLM